MKLFRPQKPHFFKPILPGFKNGIRIPESFSQHFLGAEETRPEEALLKKDGKEWSVDVIDEHFTGAGWRRFAEETGLKSGDFMVFQHQGNMVFNAMIFDAITQCGSKPLISTKTEHEVEREDLSYSGSDSEELPDISNLSLSENDDEYPSFTNKISQYSITKQCLYVPMDFARSNGFTGKTEMILMNESGRRWRVNLRTDYCHCCITHGWKDFRVGNGIKRGDAFKFEVVENGQVPVVRFTVTVPGGVGSS